MSDSLQPHRRQPTRLRRPWDSPGKNTGVGCHFLLQEIFPTQRSNLGFLNCRRILYCLSHPELLLYFICKFKVGNVTYKYFPCSVVLSFLSLNKVFHRANVFHSCWSPSYLFFFFFYGHALVSFREGNGTPLQCSCLENPRGGGAWWAAVYGVAQSQTRLTWLSSMVKVTYMPFFFPDGHMCTIFHVCPSR